jgi:hypothetical protein
MKAKIVLISLFVALATMGFDCINDSFLVSVNVNGITGKFKINPGNNPNFGPPGDCVTITASQYLDQSYSDEIQDVRIFDIKVSTIGTYAGNVNGTATVNNVAILNYSGPWSSFNTPQSLLTSQLITRSAGGIGLLVNAIKNKQTIVLCGVGSVSQVPVPDGLYIQVDVSGQVDAKPK